MQTATVDPLVGRTLEGRYRILSRIARGGMSTVYEAVDERLDRLVAVKVMSAALSADPAFSDRFSREARTAARLTHVNAVAVYDQGYDVGPAGHHVFLVMELVDGRTLRDLMRERGRFPPAQAISLVEPVLSALAAAHHAGLVHRDVKPENILLSDEGIVKVADFGLARAIETDAAATRTGLMMGTVAYCAPEQISRGESDARADVYSTGVVLFELLTGKTPYHGKSAMNVAYQHVHNRVPAPSSRVKGIPSEIDELVVNATDSDPSGRPADAGEFLAEIADAREELNLPIVPLPPRNREPSARARSSRAGAADADTDALGAARSRQNTEFVDGRVRHDTQLVGGHAHFDPPPGPNAPPPPVVTPPPKPRKQRSERSRRRRKGLIILVIILMLGIAAGVAGWWYASGRYSHVPDVRGERAAVARSELDNAGYKLGNSSNEFSETVPKGQIMGTDPDTGARLVRGHTVDITVSLGKDRIVVPDVRKATVPDAEAALKARGLHFVETQHSSDSVKPNQVIGTQPKASSKVKRDTVVKIVISTGPPIVTIPDISQGTTYDQAVAELTKAHFHVTRTEEYSTDVDEGDVIAISPTGQAVKFSMITITVSKGPQMVTVPEIHRLSPVADAETALTAAGLNSSVELASIPGATGEYVWKISPKSGKQVPIGTTVVITAI